MSCWACRSISSQPTSDNAHNVLPTRRFFTSFRMTEYSDNILWMSSWAQAKDLPVSRGPTVVLPERFFTSFRMTTYSARGFARSFLRFVRAISRSLWSLWSLGLQEKIFGLSIFLFAQNLWHDVMKNGNLHSTLTAGEVNRRFTTSLPLSKGGLEGMYI